MKKSKGFLRLVVAISILVFLIMSVYTFYELETGYYSTRAYLAGLKGDSPIGGHIILGMLGGAVSTISIWIIYGLTIFVVKGFKGQKMGVDMQKGKGFFRLVVAISILVYIIFSFIFFIEPIDGSILRIMLIKILAAVPFVIPIWIIYGLTIFVVKGFKGQKKGERK